MADPARAMEALSQLALLDDRARIDRILAAARDMLGMDIAYFSQFTPSEQVVLDVSGDSDAFGFGEGTRAPINETFCQRMLNDQIPSVIPDTHREPGLEDLVSKAAGELPAGYVGVPLQLSSGVVYGTLCCASTDARPELDERDLSFMQVLARLLSDALERPTVFEAASDEPSGAPVIFERDGDMARVALWLVATPKAVQASRRALDCLAEHVPEQRMHDLHVVASEVVSNAVRHAGVGPDKAVGIQAAASPRRLHVEITDPGPGFDPADVPEPEAGTPGGWGLYLVENLTDGWGVNRDDGLNRVWFELRLA